VEKWITERHLQECHQLQTLCVLWAAVDALMLWDNVNPCNSAAGEILLRHCCNPLEQVYERCSHIEHTRGKDNRCQWGLMDKYCLIRSRRQRVRVAHADRAVKKEMQQEAEFRKYLNKSLSSGAP
jgi:hypothetical protein